MDTLFCTLVTRVEHHDGCLRPQCLRRMNHKMCKCPNHHPLRRTSQLPTLQQEAVHGQHNVDRRGRNHIHPVCCPTLFVTLVMLFSGETTDFLTSFCDIRLDRFLWLVLCPIDC